MYNHLIGPPGLIVQEIVGEMVKKDLEEIGLSIIISMVVRKYITSSSRSVGILVPLVSSFKNFHELSTTHIHLKWLFQKYIKLSNQ